MSRKRCVMRQRDAEAIVRSRGWRFEPTTSGDIFIPEFIPPRQTRHDWRRGGTVLLDADFQVEVQGHHCVRCGLVRVPGVRCGPWYYLPSEVFTPRHWLPCAEVQRRAVPGVLLHRDGNAWCAVRPDFIDLQQSPAGFGYTQEKAIAELERYVREKHAPPEPSVVTTVAYCDDKNPCTDDACDPGISSLEAEKTPARIPIAQASIPGTAPRNHDGTDCDDNNPCIDDRCDKEPAP